ncbi:Protein 21.1 [Giardia lamblia P15]|uniref:Protein 21.1 n=1 Tax=Giardia intestinalis (strain P15) TaxID=658858 RepID=E1EY59_GIAIA|nr:Protein 21.1 [Giardia lamblia P15]
MASRHGPSLEDWFSATINQGYANINEWVDAMARSVDKNRETALMKAVRAQDSQMVKILAKHEAGETNDKGYTALIIAAINNLGSLCAILAPLESNVTLSGGRTALMMAASVSACSSIKALIPIQYGRRDDNGMTALMYAVTYGNIDAASALVDREKRILSSDNKSALIIAAEHYRKDMIQLLYPYEHGLLPDAEKIVLAPYKFIASDAQCGISSSGSTTSSDAEAESCKQRSKSASFYQPSRSSSLTSAPHCIRTTSNDSPVDHQRCRSSLDLSWSESHAPHKIRSIRIKFSPQRSGNPSHFCALQSRQQRAKSTCVSQRSNHATSLAQRQLTTSQHENHKLLRTNLYRNAFSKSPIKTFVKVGQQTVGRQYSDSCQKPRKLRQSSEEFYRQYLLEQEATCVPHNNIHHQLSNDEPQTAQRRRTTFTPSPTPKSSETKHNLLSALGQHILTLERKLLKKEQELQTLVSLNQGSRRTTPAPHKRTSIKPTYEITFTQCATQTEAKEEYNISRGVQGPVPPCTTRPDTMNTMKKLQENAYLKQLCTSLSLVKEDILSLCTAAQQERTPQRQLASELLKDPGSLDHELEDDTFVVFIPCNHLIDLAYFVMKNHGEKSISITECPRCGVQPTSFITVRM